MDTPTSTLTLADGRTVAWAVYGPPLDSPTPAATFFYCHGFPGSRFEARLLPASLLAKLNLRCIALDRPGMGRSTDAPARKLLDFPADLVAVADHLAIETFHVLGVSGGAPYALACARELRATGRLRRVACVAGLYPPSLGMAGMMPANRALFMLGAYMPRWLTGFVLDSQLGKPARDPDREVLGRLFDKELAGRLPVEKDVVAEVEGSRDVCVESLREAMAQGASGAATDLMLYNDWGFGLDEVDGQGLSLWHGRLDLNVPAAMAEKAGKALPGSKVHIFDDEGHLSTPLRHLDEILGEMVAED